MKFEAHITFPRRDASIVKELALTSAWKFSQIDGDPVLGTDVFCYLTSYGTEYLDLKMLMDNEAQRARNVGAEVVRTKVEQVVFDSATGGPQ